VGPSSTSRHQDETLYLIYRLVAKILLELSVYSFDHTSALLMIELEDGIHSWAVQSAPMTLKMDEIERSGNVKVGSTSCFEIDVGLGLTVS
jgi:hypothetical protein